MAFREPQAYGCTLTLAGYGYPYTQIDGARVPVDVGTPLTCEVWWNEVEQEADGRLFASGHRIADVMAIAGSLEGAIGLAYENIRKIRCLGSYYRTDVGQSLWPPGKA